jgi:hypothetical protein
VNRWVQGLLTVLFFLLVSVGFSWPLVTDPTQLHISRQFDIYSLVWLVQAVGADDAGWTFARSAWPMGEPLNRIDSFVLAAMAWCGGSSVDPWWYPALLTLLGPVVSAWAAERFAARHLGAAWPWSLVAGLAYAFSGMAATAVLEGHVYVLFNPWLPLLAGAWMRVTGGQGGLVQGLLAGLWWTLALLTSAYIGVGATLIVVVLAGAGLVARSMAWRGVVGAAVVAVPAGLAYTWVFISSGAGSRALSRTRAGESIQVMDAGSMHLDSLAGWHGFTDFGMHSMSGAVGFVALSLALFSPWMCWKSVPLRRCLLLGLIAVVIALGPRLQLHHDDLRLFWVLAPLGEFQEVSSFFQFPGRLMWVAGLALGGAAAVAATHLAREHGPLWAAPLLLMAVADVCLTVGMPMRGTEIRRGTPEVYEHVPPDRAVLDLMPDFLPIQSDLALYTNNLGCAHQASHRRALASRCLGTTIGTGPRAVVGGWLSDAVMQEAVDGADIVLELETMGFGAVVMHPDLYSSTAREALAQGLEAALGPPAVISRDGGEHLVMYAVPADTPLDMDEARSRYEAMEAAYQ